MTDASVREWVLSGDRLHLVIVRKAPQGGTITTTLDWKTPATNEQVAYALEHRPTFKNHGQSERRVGRAWRTRLGRWFYYKNVGPPTWWLPRLSFMRWGIKTGWLRTAVVVTWERPRPESKESGGSTRAAITGTEQAIRPNEVH